ncbi:LytR/AlgR family response regulator transcription factor [Spirosoma fluviale]|uniref:Two component transcriptional regulator, LytTR family n=1 Tax=Spirosoma fluviale TaxID=1597977 RepID=A0A286GDY6_9BACT|nr:response regulator [Spirosoma fluviale]SOD93717.1 two component transcriptional regulator, LytTR family [Spirosoma fluviale]
MISDERIHILLVEDEGILAMELSDSLEADGYFIVGIANNGRKALDLYQRQRVDLLLCDITIKGDWDGIETVRRLTAERPIPVIYLTALTDRETLERAKQTYPAAYVNKPYQLASLRTAIELAIHNFNQRSKPVSAAVTPLEKGTRDRETILQINDHLFVKQNYQFVKINVDDLLYLEADNVYTTLVTSNRKYVIRLTLSGILERMNLPSLVRIHRSYAVNIHKVDSFNDTELSIGTQLLPLSRSYKEDFLQRFNHY